MVASEASVKGNNPMSVVCCVLRTELMLLRIVHLSRFEYETTKRK